MCSLEIKRYKAKIAYDGTNFSGFQIQPEQRTVQGEIEKTLKTIAKGKITRIQPSGRTDAGAHAKGLSIHFDFMASIPKDGLFKALNTLLPLDIVVLELTPVSDDFHARYAPSEKVYTYRVDNQKIRNPFTRNFAYHHPYPIDMERTQKALNYLVGKHDFTSFCSTKTDKENKVRTLKEARIEQDEQTKEYIFTFAADGFLYNMIRIIIGTVLPIADGRKEVESMQEILHAKDRNQAGLTAPAHGLCLEKVIYLNEKKL